MSVPAAELDFAKVNPFVRRQLRPLTKLDNWHAPLLALQDLAVVALSVYLCLGLSWWCYPVSAVLVGSTHRAMAHLLHESAHKTLAKNPTVNLIFGTVFSGYLVLHLLTPYRASHIGGHHRFLGEAEDPDYEFHRRCGLYDPAESATRLFTKNILLALLGFRTVSYARYIARDRIFSTAPREAVSTPIPVRTEQVLLVVQWAAIVAVAAVFGWLPLLLLFWFVPMFTTGIAIGWLCELTEHYPLPESETKQVLLTRNRRGWAVENFVFGRHCENYHQVHHLHAGIPTWNLRRAHRIMLKDPAYAAWDSTWGGVFTRPRGGADRETTFSYAAKYRDWRRAGGDPATASPTFAEAMTMARVSPPVPVPERAPEPAVAGLATVLRFPVRTSAAAAPDDVPPATPLRLAA